MLVVVSIIVATHTVSPTALSALMEPRSSPFSAVNVTQSLAEVPVVYSGSRRATPLSVAAHR